MIKLFLFNCFRIIFEILYFFSNRFIKKEYVIIGGYKSRFLSGNNLYLYNFLMSEKPGFEFFFYTKDKKTYKELNQKYPGKIIYSYRMDTFVKLLKAKVIVITTGPDDFSPYPLLKNVKIINIWHGIPIKTIGSTGNLLGKKLAKYIDFFSVSSEFDGKIIQSAFNLPEDKIFISGLTKNDYINFKFNDIKEKHPFLKKKVIIYAPTFREKQMKQKLFSDIFPISELHKLLEKYDAYFLYRSHFDSSEQKITDKYSRIISASPEEFPDAQPLLFFSDIMITDYSGIYFDYLLMNRPIIFYNYDYDEYVKHRGFLYDYYENTPGQKVQTKEMILNVIEQYLINPEKDSEKRIKIKQKFHKYSDGKASERTYELIKKLL